jgi:hypothetical protein
MDDQIITKELLEEFGVELDGKDVESLLTHLNTALDERVGTEVTESLSDEKLEELLSLQETDSDEQVGEWINENVPDLQQITQDEIDILLGELAENSDAINDAA